MPFDSNGNFSLNSGYLAVDGQTIQPSQHNPPLEDLAGNGLSAVLVKDGRAPMNGDLKMGGFKIRNIADGTLSTDAASKGQLDGRTTRGYLFGLTLSNNAVDAVNDIDIATGAAASDDIAPTFIILASVMTKRLDAAWVAGSGGGGLDTGAIANTSYHVFLIQRSDTGMVDVLFSASATAPTMPANYNIKRRIGSIIREAATIVPFRQYGNIFKRLTAVVDYSASSARAASLITLSVPTGIPCQPIVGSTITSGVSGDGRMLFGDGDVGSGLFIVARAYNAQASGAAFTTEYVNGGFMTNLLAQIFMSVVYASGAGASVAQISTYGWIDSRGRIS